MDLIDDMNVKSWDIEVLLTGGPRKNLKSKIFYIVGKHNNLEIPLIEGGWVCYAAGEWVGFTAQPTEGTGD